MRFLSIVLSLFLYSFSYPLCEYFFSDDTELWWKFKYTLFSTIILLLVLSHKANDKGLEREKWVNFATNWFLGILVFDLIDRCFFESVLRWNDWVGLIVSGCVAWYQKNK